MKPLTENQIREHEAASRRGALEGAAAGAAIATSSGWYLNRRWATYRNLPFSLKVLGGVIIVAPLLAIRAERRGLEYDRSQWDGVSVQMLEEKQVREETHWKQLSASEKMKDWAIRHQYSLIIGGWATSLCLAGAVIWRNKYQTPAQKIVQARMWAQGLTIGLLIAAGALTHQRGEYGTRPVKVDHSWAEIEQHERERLAAESAAEPRKIS